MCGDGFARRSCYNVIGVVLMSGHESLLLFCQNYRYRAVCVSGDCGNAFAEICVNDVVLVGVCWFSQESISGISVDHTVDKRIECSWPKSYRSYGLFLEIIHL